MALADSILQLLVDKSPTQLAHSLSRLPETVQQHVVTAIQADVFFPVETSTHVQHARGANFHATRARARDVASANRLQINTSADFVATRARDVASANRLQINTSPDFPGIIVLSANARYLSMLRNAMRHYALMPGAPALAVHCLDSVTHVTCLQDSQGRADVRCVQVPALNISRYGKVEALLMYKLQAVRDELLRLPQGRSALLLDVDALILSRPCFDEMNAYPESIVAQAGGCPGCTDRICQALGAVFNTGAMLLRPSALQLLEPMLGKWEAHRNAGGQYSHHCFEQEAFNNAVSAAKPQWLAFPERVVLRAPALGNLTLRMLPISRWPAGLKLRTLKMRYNGSLYRLNQGGIPSGDVSWRNSTCVLHAIGEGVQANATFMRHGLWHL